MRFPKLLSVTLVFVPALVLGAAACSSESPSVQASNEAPRTAATPNAKLVFAHPDNAAAKASLETLAKVVGQGDPEARGFHSVDEARSAIPAAGLPMYMVGLDGLKAYGAGQDPHALLIDQEAVMFPITVGGDVRSAVVLKKRAGDVWEAASFGHKNIAKAAHTSRTGVFTARSISDTTSFFVVGIPTLGARFLGHDENGQLMLTPLNDVPGTSLHAGQTQNANAVLAVLHPLALTTRADVPN